jgi:predicted short-subunit dehydrogenase-like oxidoreductase (DUF2520 family)
VNTLNVIGCGRVGKTLARLWTEHNVFVVRCVLNTSPDSASRAVDFIGAGRAAAGYDQLEQAELFMISAPDHAIPACCRQLCRTGLLHRGVVVFHCSGSLSSTVLEPAQRHDAWIASAHPVKSFVEPQVAVKTFAGTFCALEGDPQACEVLCDALQRCGAIPFLVAPQGKTIYHAATVFVCNYLAVLMEVGLRCFEQAGVGRETAVKAAEPLIRGTLDNLIKLGPTRALTGPIARGEVSVVARQVEALGHWDAQIRDLYRTLGQLALELSAAQGNADTDSLAAIRALLGPPGSQTPRRSAAESIGSSPPRSGQVYGQNRSPS